MTKQNLDIDRYDQTVTATKTTERESRDLDRQPKIELNRYDRKSMLAGTGTTKKLIKTDTTEINPTNTTKNESESMANRIHYNIVPRVR